MEFQYKEFFWSFLLIPVLILLFLLVLLWKKRTVKKIGEERLVNLLIKNYSPRLFMLKFIFFVIAFAAGILALANLRKPGSTDNIAKRGIDIVIALDVSRSMLATDIAPDRLERAKQLALKLMEKMPDDRVALVLFAGKAYMQMPLTADHAAAAMFISTASPDAIPAQGTVFADALQMSYRVFNPAERRFKTIILLTDGENHDEDALKTAEELAKKGVMICTIGIGSAAGSRIPDPATGDFKKDATGNTVITKLNEELLKQLATKTNGVYFNLQSTDEVVDGLVAQLSQIEKKPFEDKSLLNYKSYYTWFAGLMLLLLIIEFLLPERRHSVG